MAKRKAENWEVVAIIDRAIAAIRRNDEAAVIASSEDYEVGAVERPWSFFDWEHHRVRLSQLRDALAASAFVGPHIHACIENSSQDFSTSVGIFAAL